MRWVLPLVMFGVVGLRGGPARADALPPPPRDCPPAAEPDSCHAGPFCGLAQCSSDASCEGDLVCAPVQVCLGRPVDCGGGAVGTVLSTCEIPKECPDGRCSTVMGCVRAGLDTGNATSGGTSPGATAAATTAASATTATTTGQNPVTSAGVGDGASGSSGGAGTGQSDSGGSGQVADRGCGCHLRSRAPTPWLVSVLLLGLARCRTSVR